MVCSSTAIIDFDELEGAEQSLAEGHRACEKDLVEPQQAPSQLHNVTPTDVPGKVGSTDVSPPQRVELNEREAGERSKLPARITEGDPEVDSAAANPPCADGKTECVEDSVAAAVPNEPVDLELVGVWDFGHGTVTIDVVGEGEVQQKLHIKFAIDEQQALFAGGFLQPVGGGWLKAECHVAALGLPHVGTWAWRRARGGEAFSSAQECEAAWKGSGHAEWEGHFRAQKLLAERQVPGAEELAATTASQMTVELPSAHEAMALGLSDPRVAAEEAQRPLSDEEQRVKEESARMRQEMEQESLTELRSQAEVELERRGGVRAVTMHVKLPDAAGKSAVKKVKAELVDGLNVVVGTCVDLLKSQVTCGKDADQWVLDVALRFALVCQQLRHLTHFRYETHANSHFQAFVDLITRPRTGLTSVCSRWVKLEEKERGRKVEEFRETTDKVLADMATCIRKLSNMAIVTDPRIGERLKNKGAELVEQVCQTGGDPKSNNTSVTEESAQWPPLTTVHKNVSALQSLLSWTPLTKVTVQSGTRMLVELRDAFADPSFQREYNRARKGIRPGDATHVEKALEEQSKVLPRFGFEGSLKGVQEMRKEIHVLTQFDPPLKKVQADIHQLLQFGKPLPRLPVIRPFTAPRFQAADKNGWKAHLASEGFAIIADVLREMEVTTAYKLLWDFIERSDSRGFIKRSKVMTWGNAEKSNEGWPAGQADGIIHSRGIGQSEVMWYLRGLPRLRRVFADLWGTDRLVTSFDGVGVFRPYGLCPNWKTTKKNWFHVDQAHQKRGLHCVQGLVTLKAASAQTGGLVVVPRSHRFHTEVLRTYKEPENGWNFVMLNSNDRVLTESDLGPKLLVASAGDLILWDSRTVHCNTLPVVEEEYFVTGQDLLRAVGYVCMTPAAWCSEETLKQRQLGARRRVTTSHWPHEYHAMDSPAAGEEEVYFELTREQKELIAPLHPTFADQVPLPGAATFLEQQSFRVVQEGARLRRCPTVEWGDPLEELSRGAVLRGQLFGRWLRLAEEHRRVGGDGQQVEETWVSLDSEEDPKKAVLELVS